MAELDIAIVSGCTRLRYASYVGQQLYARRHGLGYHLELTAFDGVDGYWHKVAALDGHLAGHDWVVWLDDDAFVTDLDSTFLRDAIDDADRGDAWLVIAPSCADELNGAWAAYNTGVFALRNSPDSRALLSAMSEAPMEEIQRWWDIQRLGVFTQGDQDALAWFVEQRGYRESVHWVDPLGWNARPWHYRDALDDAPVCHFAGQPDKTLAIMEFAQRMGTDETLVRPGVARRADRGLHAQVAVASNAGVRLRRTSLRGQHLVRRVRRKVTWVRENRRWS